MILGPPHHRSHIHRPLVHIYIIGPWSTYTSAPGSLTPPLFIGEVQLSWSAVAPGPNKNTTGSFEAVVPAGVSFDVQDQLFISDGAGGGRRPLIRARTPNGKPWLPLDGFSLNVWKNFGSQYQQFREPAAVSQCSGSGSGHADTCSQAVVRCQQPDPDHAVDHRHPRLV